MRAVTILFGGILTLMILALAYRIIVPSEPTYSPARYNTYLLDQERAEAIAPLKTFASATWWALLAVAPALGLGAIIAIAADRARHRRPDARGLLPVAAEDAPAAALDALAAHHAVALAQAQRVVYPHSLNYSPKITSTATTTGQAAALPTPSPLTVPSLADLLGNGTIGRDAPTKGMILGYTAEGPITGGWDKLFSCAVGGIAGSGKSSTIAFLLAQSALRGARLYLIDPHGGDRESLATRLDPLAPAFFIDPADDTLAMGRAVRVALAEVERRMKCDDRSPLVVMVDEFTSLQRSSLADDLSKLVEVLGQEGRKKGVYGLFLGQAWTAARSGGSAGRDSLASAFVHRLRASQARYLTGLRAEELPPDVHDLAPGEAYLLSTAGDMTRVRVPFVTEQAVQMTGRMLTDTAPTLTIPRQAPGKPEAVAVPTHPNALDGLTTEEQRILERFLGGESIPDICRAISGAVNGRAYTKAQADVAAALRKSLQR